MAAHLANHANPTANHVSCSNPPAAQSYALVTIGRNGVYNGQVSVSAESLQASVSEDADPTLRLTLERRSSLAADVRVGWRAKVSLTSTPAEDAAALGAELRQLQGSVLCPSGSVRCPLEVALLQDARPERSQSYLVVLISAEPSAELDAVNFFANVTSLPSDHPDGLVQLRSRRVTVDRADASVDVSIDRLLGNDRPANVTYSTSEIAAASFIRAGVTVRRAVTNRDFAATAGVAHLAPGTTSVAVRVALTADSDGAQFPKVFVFSIIAVSGGAAVADGGGTSNVTLVDSEDKAAWDLLSLPLATPTNFDSALAAAQRLADPGAQLSGTQLEIVKSFLSNVNAAAAAMSLAPSQRLAAHRVYCSLMQPTRADATAASSQLLHLLEQFNFAITPAACELSDQEFRSCPDSFVSQLANLRPSSINSKVYLNTAGTLGNGQPYFQLPGGLLPDSNSSSCTKLQFNLLKSTQWFRRPDRQIVADTIYAVEVDRPGLPEITSQPVRFKVLSFGRRLVDRRARCAYWSGSDWLSNYCSVTNQAGLDAGQDDFVTCECTHLSAYAVVIDSRSETLIGYSLPFYICTGLAAALYLLVILGNCFLTSNRSQFSSHLHLHLLAALFIFHVVYIANAALSPSSILVSTKAQGNDRCIAVGILQTYFFLCGFFWMLAQSVNYWKVLVMNDEHTNRNYYVFIVIGWAVPAVWVLLCTVVSYAVFLNFFDEISPERLMGDVNNNGFICYLNQLYVLLIAVMLPILVVLVGVIFVFVNAYQVLPQWAMYDDICKGRPNYQEVRHLLIFWTLLLGCTIFGGLHMAFASLWWLAVFAALDVITAVFAFVFFFLLRGPTAMCRRMNAGHSYEIHEEWSPTTHVQKLKEFSGLSGTVEELPPFGAEDPMPPVAPAAVLPQPSHDRIQLVHEGSDDRWSDQQPQFNADNLAFDSWEGTLGGRVELPDELDGEADDNGDFDDLLSALKSDVGDSDSDGGHSDSESQEEEEEDSGTAMSVQSEQQSQHWRMSIADTHL